LHCRLSIAIRKGDRSISPRIQQCFYLRTIFDGVCDHYDPYLCSGTIYYYFYPTDDNIVIAFYLFVCTQLSSGRSTYEESVTGFKGAAKYTIYPNLRPNTLSTLNCLQITYFKRKHKLLYTWAVLKARQDRDDTLWELNRFHCGILWCRNIFSNRSVVGRALSQSLSLNLSALASDT
jgi:hypothetical protein